MNCTSFEECDRELLLLAPQLQKGDERAILKALKVSDRRIQLSVEQQIQAGVERELRSLLNVLNQELSADEFRRVMAAISAIA